MAQENRNKAHQAQFNLPSDEKVIDECKTVLWMMEHEEFGKYFGKLVLGDRFLCFATTDNPRECWTVLPYFGVRRLERIATPSQIHAVTITTMH